MKRLKKFLAIVGCLLAVTVSLAGCAPSRPVNPNLCAVCGRDPCICPLDPEPEPEPDNRLRVTVVGGVGGGLYEPGTTANIYAPVPAGSAFLHWSEGESVFSTKNPCVFTVTKSVTLTAVLYKDEPPKEPTAAVTVAGGSGAGEYEIGQAATVSAVVPAGQAFSVWKEGDTVVSNKASYTFKVTRDIALTACYYTPSALPAPKTYTNPVLKADRPDPAVTRVGDTFYMYSTASRTPNLNTSKDLINWSSASLDPSFSPYAGTNGSGTWAPDIVTLNGKYMLYYSRSVWGDANPGIGVSSSDSPTGPWQNHGKLFTSKEIGVDNSIDPTVFTDREGRVYIIWGSFRGIFGVELTADGLGFADGSLQEANANKTLVAGIVGGWDGETYEAPYVIYKDGYYYMFVSLGTCCEGANSTYRVRVGRSESPLGPYVGSDGRDMLGRNRGHLVLQRNGSKVVGPGHNSVVVDDIGQYWIVYHMFSETSAGNYSGRWVGIDKLNWDNDGWPSVSGGVASVTQNQGPVFLP